MDWGDFLDIKHWLKCYGSTTVGERGQVVLPAEVRKLFKIEPGEKLIVLGADNMGFESVMLMKSEAVTKMVEQFFGAEKIFKESIKKSGVLEDK